MEKAEAGKYKFICFTGEGCRLMRRLRSKALLMDKQNAEDNESNFDQQDEEWNVLAKVTSLSEWIKENFCQGNVLVFIGATGIAVRAIAPFCKDKTTDPAVIVIDEKGSFVIPILSGHIGGGVGYAKELASYIGATPVITTATDVRDEFAVDVFAKENDLSISDMKLAKKCSARLLAGEETEFTVTPKAHREDKLYLIPKCTVVGMGCRKGKSFDELNDFFKDTLIKQNIDPRSLKAIVSVDNKKDEQGLLELASFYGVPFVTYAAEVLMEQTGDFDHSDLVMEVTGADNVCERSVAAFGCSKIIQKKLSKDGMTIAIGMTDVVIEF
jgi:cobalt-precorrin 5A hydrolase